MHSYEVGVLQCCKVKQNIIYYGLTTKDNLIIRLTNGLINLK